MSIGNVLVIRPGALGDAVLTLPALNVLRAAGGIHAAAAHGMTVLGTPASWAFIGNESDSKHCIELADFTSSDWLGLFADGAALSSGAQALLKRTQTAIVYLPADSGALERRLRSFGVENILNIDPRVASGENASRHSAQNGLLDWRQLPPCHAARRLLDPLAPLVSADVMKDALDPAHIEQLNWLASHPDEMLMAQQFLLGCGTRERGFFALHPGSGGRKKCWPAARFAQLATHLIHQTGLQALVFFGPADDFVRGEFEAAMPPEVPWRAVSLRPLRQVLALLHSCRFFVGNDSGLSHLAARTAPVLTLFGPTDSSAWAPLGRRVAIVDAESGDLKSLSVERVVNEVLTNLKPEIRNLCRTEK